MRLPWQEMGVPDWLGMDHWLGSVTCGPEPVRGAMMGGARPVQLLAPDWQRAKPVWYNGR